MLLPAVRAKGWLISVINALVATPAPLPTLTMRSASSTDFSIVGMKAPVPAFTSITRASRPAASF